MRTISISLIALILFGLSGPHAIADHVDGARSRQQASKSKIRPTDDDVTLCLPLKNVHSFLNLSHLRPAITSPDEHYVAPNELHPKSAAQRLKSAPSGLYLTVGADRAFNLASLAAGTNLLTVDYDPSSGPTHLVSVDYDPCVVEFNVINAILIAIAKDREDYLNLRTKSDLQTWLQRAKDNRYPLFLETADGSKRISLAQAWHWWEHWVRVGAFDYIHDKPERTMFADLRNGNYLYYDRQFQKLQVMARAGRIESYVLDINQEHGKKDELDVARLVDAIEKSKVRLSVLDLSNAWWPHYIKPENTRNLIDKLKPLAQENAILLYSVQGRGHNFDHRSLPFRSLDATTPGQSFINHVRLR